MGSDLVCRADPDSRSYSMANKVEEGSLDSFVIQLQGESARYSPGAARVTLWVMKRGDRITRRAIQSGAIGGIKMDQIRTHVV